LLSPVNLFQMIGLAMLSGQLVMRSSSDAVYFVFRKGKLNYGFSLESRKKIGQILLDSGLITLDELDRCLADQKARARWKKLGTIAVEKGYLQLEDVVGLFFSQIKDLLLETLAWTTGSFTFYDSSPLDDDDIVLEENVDSLIFHCLVLLDENGAN
jgi:hypothetical protein